MDQHWNQSFVTFTRDTLNSPKTTLKTYFLPPLAWNSWHLRRNVQNICKRIWQMKIVWILYCSLIGIAWTNRKRVHYHEFVHISNTFQRTIFCRWAQIPYCKFSNQIKYRFLGPRYSSVWLNGLKKTKPKERNLSQSIWNTFVCNIYLDR